MINFWISEIISKKITFNGKLFNYYERKNIRFTSAISAMVGDTTASLI